MLTKTGIAKTTGDKGEVTTREATPTAVRGTGNQELYKWLIYLPNLIKSYTINLIQMGITNIRIDVHM